METTMVSIGAILLPMLLFGLVFGFFAAARMLTSWRIHRAEVRQHAPPPQYRPSGPGIVIAGFLAGCCGFALLGMLVVGWSYVRMEGSTREAQVATMQSATVSPQHVEVAPAPSTLPAPAPATAIGESASETSPSNSTPATASPAQADGLPAWTKQAEIETRAGMVPTVRITVHSSEWATTEEAEREAMSLALTKFRERLQKQYPDLTLSISEATFRRYALKESFTEQRTRKFGEFTEPMVVVWMNFEDSPHVREPVVDAVRSVMTQTRTLNLAVLCGVVLFALGSISMLLRSLAAEPGRRLAPFVFCLILVGTGLALLYAIRIHVVV